MDKPKPKTKPQAEHERTICKYITVAPHALYDLGVGPKTEWQVLHKFYPKMKLYGVEPLPLMYHSLIEQNFPGDLHQLAIASDIGERDFYVGSGFKNMDSSLHPVPNYEEVIKVQCITLDQFDGMCGKPSNILLWMDIEGSEADALASGAELMESGRVAWVNMEVRDTKVTPNWCLAQEIKSAMVDWGYQLVKTYNDHKTHRDVIYVHEDFLPR